LRPPRPGPARNLPEAPCSPHHLHRRSLYAERDHDGPFSVRSIGARLIRKKDKARLIGDLVANLPRDDAGKGPIIVSFNCDVFDLPVCATGRSPTA
jgi:hypothetical protein